MQYRMPSYCILCGALAALSRASAAASIPSVEIAPSVWMPRVIMNAHNYSTTWIQVGGRGMDSALDYGDVKQKEMGDAIKSSGLPRSEFFVTTKVPCCPAGPFCADNPTHRACMPFEAMWDCDAARNTSADIQHDLDIIGTNYVDLLLLHFPCNRWEDTVRTWRSLEAAALSGKTRAIGVSNFPQADIEKLVAVAQVPPRVNQAGFSIGAPQNASFGRDWATINRCKELGVTYEAYGPLGEPHNTVPTSKVDVLNHPVVKSVAARNNRSTALIAYRWVVQHDMILITSSTSPAHMREEFDIFQFELSSADMAELDAVGMDTFIAV